MYMLFFICLHIYMFLHYYIYIFVLCLDRPCFASVPGGGVLPGGVVGGVLPGGVVVGVLHGGVVGGVLHGGVVGYCGVWCPVRILHPGTQAGAARYCPVRRGSLVRIEIPGCKLIIRLL